MTKISPSTHPSPLGGEGRVRGVSVNRTLVHWDLFGAWDLVIGISSKDDLCLREPTLKEF
jgi:hypothetical protein